MRTEVKMVNWRLMLLACVPLWTGCAGNMTPEQTMAHEIFVQVASHCESRYHTIHVDQIDLDGGLKIHADADSSTVHSSPATSRASRRARRSGEKRVSRSWKG
jgi:hypothetical protein